MEPTETFTSTKKNHVETELTYKDTTEVLGVLTTCLVCLEHAAIRDSLEVMKGGGQNTIWTGVKEKQDSTELNNGIRRKITAGL